MSKVLADVGKSVADVYDVEGSIAGVENVLTKDVQAIHEMASTIASERMGSQLIRVEAAGVVASADFIAAAIGINVGITRLHSVMVLTDNSTRITRCNVNVRTQPGGMPAQTIQESAIWVWNGSDNFLIEIVDDGGAVAGAQCLKPDTAFSYLPTMLSGPGQPQLVSEVVLRGTAAAFGAGTVDIILVLHVTAVQPGGLSSKGLPVPSW